MRISREQKKAWGGAIFLLLLTGLISSCLRTPDRRHITSSGVIHPSVLFSHEVHKPVVDKMKLDCLSCHPGKKALAPLVKGKKPGPTYTCHQCHRNEMNVGQAPQRCALCHSDLKPSKPADHRLDWMKRHATFARIDEAKCSSCHEKASCNDCHLQRDPIQQTVHPRTYQYSHSVEARSNPNACGSCHQLNYCRNCHVGKGVTF